MLIRSTRINRLIALTQELAFVTIHRMHELRVRGMGVRIVRHSQAIDFPRFSKAVMV